MHTCPSNFQLILAQAGSPPKKHLRYRFPIVSLFFFQPILCNSKKSTKNQQLRCAQGALSGASPWWRRSPHGSLRGWAAPRPTGPWAPAAARWAAAAPPRTAAARAAGAPGLGALWTNGSWEGDGRWKYRAFLVETIWEIAEAVIGWTCATILGLTHACPQIQPRT